MDTLRFSNRNEEDFLDKENQGYLKSMHTERLEIIRSDYSDEINHLYDIVLKETGKKVGWVNLIEKDVDDYIEIWYSILKKYRNQGICTEALEVLINNSPNKSFYIETWSSNKASIQVGRKLEEKLNQHGFNCFVKKSLLWVFFFEKN